MLTSQIKFIWLIIIGKPGLKIVTDMVANATNILSLANKNSGLVTTLATRFPYDLDLNWKSKSKTNIFCYLTLLSP